MALIFIEGFDAFNSTGQNISSELMSIGSTSRSGNLITARAGRDGGYSLQVYSTFSRWVHLPVTDKPDSTWIIGMNMYMPDAVGIASNNSCFNFVQEGNYGDNKYGVGIAFTAAGAVQAVSSGGAVLATSADGVIPNQTWFHLQFKCFCDPAVGTVEVKINTVTVASATGLDTDSDLDPGITQPRFTAIRFRGASSNSAYNPYFDDLYICDSTGTVNNDFLGELYVRTVFPTSDAGPNDWTPDSGVDHYEMLNEVNVENTTNLTVDGDGDSEMFGYTPLSNVDTVFGLALRSSLGKTQSGEGFIQHIADTGTTSSILKEHFVCDGSYRGETTITTENPDTDANWTETEINNSTFGFSFLHGGWPSWTESDPVKFKAELNRLIPNNPGVSYTVSDVTVPNGTTKFHGGVIAPDGNFYMCPRKYTSGIGKIDTSTNVFSSIPATFVNDGYIGCVLAPNGCVYFIPFAATTVMKLDPRTDTVSYISITGLGSSWLGGVVGSNGDIYCVPFNASSILKIDTATDTVSTIGSLTAGGGKWAGGCLSRGDTIYMVPYNSTSILKINCLSDTISTFGSFPGPSKWSGAAIDPDGKIYCVPFQSNSSLVIDPSDDSTYTIGPFADYSSGAWNGACLAPNGLIYAAPYASAKVLVIDPSDDSHTTIGPVPVSSRWTGMVPGFDGRLYAASYDGTTVLKLDPNIGVDSPRDYVLSRYIDKF